MHRSHVASAFRQLTFIDRPHLGYTDLLKVTPWNFLISRTLLVINKDVSFSSSSVVIMWALEPLE